ncbi:MAG TPA: SBBP repeat-containing protein [Blastocatellia bacterium]|nr:SBBP repeat-containing protein [Blastocatellia bacterium]
MKNSSRPGKTLTSITAILLCLFSSFAPFAYSRTSKASNDKPSAPELTLQRPDKQNLPLTFEANQGQADPKVKFISRTAGFSLLLTDGEAVMLLNDSPGSDLGLSNSPKIGSTGEAESSQSQFRHLESALLKMKVVGGNASSRIEGVDALNGTSNYIIGNDRKKWRSNIINYAKAQQKDIYRGIDLVYHSSREQMEYDFIVAPEARPDCITLEFEGARELRIDASGDLVLETARGSVHQKKPFIYQEEGGQIKEIAGRYQIKGRHRVGFQVSAYDKTKTLVIDPEIVYSTYLGGTKNGANEFVTQTEITGLTVDSAGNTYVTGETNGVDFPVTPNARQPRNASDGQRGAVAEDMFITKLDPAGRLIYSTYLGGSGMDEGYGIAVGASGSVYVKGVTLSNDFPTTPGAFRTRCLCEPDLPTDTMVVKLSAIGSLVYSTYLGVPYSVQMGDIAVDTAGNAYVIGSSGYGMQNSLGVPLDLSIPLVNGMPPSDIDFQVYMIKLNATGTAILYSTYLGRGDGKAIAVDSAGNAYLTGETLSSKFPVKNALQSVKRGSVTGALADMFVAKIDTTKRGADSLVYSSYLPGSGGSDIAIGASGAVYVSGMGSPKDFPVKTILREAQWSEEKEDLPFSYLGFAAKLDLTKTGINSLVYCTFYGNIFNARLAVDDEENLYLASDNHALQGLPTINATFGGGAFIRSSDDGRSFETLDRGLTINNLSYVAIDPHNPSIIYTGFTGAVLKSIDGGLNWKNASNWKKDESTPAYLTTCLAIDPKTPSTIYAGVNTSSVAHNEKLAGVLKSTDGGDSWKTQLEDLRINVSSLAIDPTNPAIIYAGARFQQHSGVFKSTDGGNTWNVMNNGLTNIHVNTLAIDPATPATIYAGTRLGLFKSTDGGKSWSANQSLEQVIAIAIDAKTPSTIYASTVDESVSLTSIDGRGNPRKRLHSDDIIIQSDGTVAPPEGLVKSTNGGQTWKEINTGFGDLLPVTYDIKLSSHDQSMIYLATNFGVYTSSNAGESWSASARMRNHTRALAVHPRTPSVFYAASTMASKTHLAKLSADGSKFLYASYLGGNNNDTPAALAVDKAGNLYVAGNTFSTNFPTVNAIQRELPGTRATFITKISGLKNLPEAKEPAPIPDTPLPPVSSLKITSISIQGKKLIVQGENFSQRAIILLNGAEQKTSNDSETPLTKLISKKAGKKMKAAQETVIQVKNSDGTLSDEYRFTR